MGVRALLGRFDRWVGSGPFTPRDLGLYRIVFALVMLPKVLRFRWVDALPDSFYNPPPGPLAVFPGLPPDGVMLAVEVLLSIAFVALALGWRTTLVSWSTTLLMLYGYGVSYSLGKIDHTIFLVILPAVLSLARWGDALSVDAVLRRRSARAAAHGPAPTAPTTPQWAMRLFALLIGVGFFTAAYPKVLSGWLDPRSQAVRGLINKEYYVNGRTDLLAPFALDMHVTALWELADVFTVALELAFIVAVLNWRAFRTVMAVATVFHLGVLLSMNIFFSANVLVYGAFVSWSALDVRRSRRPARQGAVDALADRWGARWVGLGAAALSVVAGAGVWLLRQEVAIPSSNWLVLLVGAAVGVWYLCRQVLALWTWSRRRSVEIDVRTAPGAAGTSHHRHGDHVAPVRGRSRS